MSALEKKWFRYFFDSAVFLYFYPQYLTNGNSKAINHTIFWKNSIRFYTRKLALFWYNTCFAPNWIPIWLESHGLFWRTETLSKNRSWRRCFLVSFMKILRLLFLKLLPRTVYEFSWVHWVLNTPLRRGLVFSKIGWNMLKTRRC